MKQMLAIAMVVSMAAIASPVAGASGPTAEPLSFPAGVAPSEVRRWMRNDTTWDIATAQPNLYGAPWVMHEVLGWVSTQAFANSHPLYACARASHPYDMFTSAFAHCEGGNRVTPNLLGYVSSSQIAGTVPMYRCVAGKNEFDSLASNCEGHVMVGTLGYIFR